MNEESCYCVRDWFIWISGWRHGVGNKMAMAKEIQRQRIVLIRKGKGKGRGRGRGIGIGISVSLPTLTLSLVCAALLLLMAFVSLTLSRFLDQHRQADKVYTNLTARELRIKGLDDVPTEGDRSRKHVWSSRFSEFYYGCSDPSYRFPSATVDTKSKRYLMIAASGGLNQQRTGIIDAVVVARMLNATLVVPKLDQKSFWKDKSNFEEIFDVDWFISSLSDDVKIVKELPENIRKEVGRPTKLRVPRKCSRHCYESRVLPVLLKRHVVELTKFDYRLANKLDTEFQKLRCKVNYHALRFTKSISETGQELIDRMRKRSRRFLALHLRFEPDMLAFSGCYYGGEDKERKELGAIRKRWKTLHLSSPEKARRHGKCPLTPQEVGLMLRALGFGSDVHLYVASGEVYGGEETLAPLKALFPNFYTKDTLASKEELEPFSSYSSRMAALDYIVCDQSDVFVTNNNGNMARMLAGRRRYIGHKPTIRPNAKKLYLLFLNRHNMSWDDFALKVRAYQKGFVGEPNEARPGRGEFHEYPYSCICDRRDAKKTVINIKNQSKSNSAKAGDLREQTMEGGRANESVDYDAEGIEMDESEESSLIHQEAENDDYTHFTRTDEPELEEILSD
ncbi:hypothetical protein SUGI_0741530 [Cryptomeria japonica]|uniref:protein ROOT HAIR SPECIFIC 17 n=1 Tax=Cryptomeria japonica TaxID=3369 RepID=UPI0024146DAE|nr:protein ROOT HAIR SPECIFIC 17 [Cryptomeria japonica]GLJ36780.1 hypothetical protein SUGI_0741530 [Cryptomeria japonica]